MEENKKNKFVDSLQCYEDNNEEFYDDYDNDIDDFEDEEKINSVSIKIHSKIMEYVDSNNLPLCEYLFEKHLKSFISDFI